MGGYNPKNSEYIALSFGGLAESSKCFNKELLKAFSSAVEVVPEEHREKLSALFERAVDNELAAFSETGTAGSKRTMYTAVLDFLITSLEVDYKGVLRIRADDLYNKLIGEESPLPVRAVGHTCGSYTHAGVMFQHSKDMSTWTCATACPGCIMLRFVERWIDPLTNALALLTSELNQLGVFSRSGWVRVLGEVNDTVYVEDNADDQ